MRRLVLAIPRAQNTRDDFENFDKSLREDIPEEVEQMAITLKLWEEDKAHPDPYLLPKSSESVTVHEYH